MTKRFIFITLYLIAPFCNLFAQNRDIIRNEITKGDLDALISLYNNNPSLSSEIEDAIDGYLNWDYFTYEQVKTAYSKCIDNNNLKKELERVKIDKECDIYNYLSTITPEQLVLYSQLFPGRKELINHFLNDILYKDLERNSYSDLISLETELKGLEISKLRKELQIRENEKAPMIRKKIDNYAKYEMDYRNRLLFVLRYRSWQYFIVRYKNVAKIYSQIGIVPGDPYLMASQFNNIIQFCFSKDDFKKQLKKDVDAYNKAINGARSEFVSMAGIKDYVKSDIKVPNIGNFMTKPNLPIASKISDARQNFESSRSTASAVAGVATLFVGSTISSIGKGLYDLSAVSDLAQAEMQIRREYMRDAYNQLHKVFESYYRTIDKEITNQITSNNQKFKNYVKAQQ